MFYTRPCVKTGAVSTTLGCLMCAAQQARRHTFGAHDVMWCSQCQLGQLELLPTDEKLAQLYGTSEYYEGTDRVGHTEYLDDAPQIRRTSLAKLTRLLRVAPTTAACLRAPLRALCLKRRVMPVTNGSIDIVATAGSL